MDDATIRPATLADATAMAELVHMAGDGLQTYLWRKMAEPGEDIWDVGRRRAARETGSFSYRNTFILSQGEKTVGCLVGYALPDEPTTIDHANTPAMFVPMQELENLACGTWHVNVVAVYPEYRGKGYGSRLLATADRIGAEQGKRGLSLIVSDANTGARRLYERCGYRQSAARKMIKEGWQGPGENWLLLVKD